MLFWPWSIGCCCCYCTATSRECRVEHHSLGKQYLMPRHHLRVSRAAILHTVLHLASPTLLILDFRRPHTQHWRTRSHVTTQKNSSIQSKESDTLNVSSRINCLSFCRHTQQFQDDTQLIPTDRHPLHTQREGKTTLKPSQIDTHSTLKPS